LEHSVKFSDNFFQPPAIDGVDHIHGDDEPIYYQPERHGNLARFEGSRNQRKLIDQVERDVEEIQSFLAENDVPDTQQQLARLFEHIKDGSAGRFGGVISQFYSQGKQALDQIAAFSRDETIPLARRKHELSRLPVDLAVCGPGVVTNLLDIASNLSLSRPNFHANVQQAWGSLAENKLAAFAMEHHADDPNYQGMEIHYVNQYRNEFPDLLHQPVIDDPFVRHHNVVDHLDACRGMIEKEVNSEVLVRQLSRQCLRDIRNYYGDKIGKVLDAGEIAELEKDYETTFKKTLSEKYGEISFYSIFSPKNIPVQDRDEDSEYKFALTNNTSIIESDIIKSLQSSNYLDDVNRIEGLAELPDYEEIIQVSDNVFVVNDRGSNDTSPYRRPVLPSDIANIKREGIEIDDADLTKLANAALRSLEDSALCEHLTAEDLWPTVEIAMEGGAGWREVLNAPGMAQFQALRPEEYGKLEDWVVPRLQAADLAELLAHRAEAGRIRPAAAENMLGRWHEIGDRQQRRILGVRDEDGRSLLAWAMQEGHPQVVRAAIEAHFASGADIPDLNARDGARTPALHLALQNGHAAAVTAYIEALKEGPEDVAKTILRKRDGARNTPLFHALNNNQADAIKAFAAAISDYPEDEQVLMLRAQSAGERKALDAAIAAGHVEAVEAYLGAIRRLTPELRYALLATEDLPEADADADDQGRQAQALAAYYNALSRVEVPYDPAEEIEQVAEPVGVEPLEEYGMDIDEPEFEDALRGAANAIEAEPEPADVNIVAQEPELPIPGAFPLDAPPAEPEGLNPSEAARLNTIMDRFEEEATALGREGAAPGLTLALEEGHAELISVYRLAVSPFTPAVQAGLFEATTMDGTPALSVAIERGHAAAIDAYAQAIDHLDNAARLELLSVVDGEEVERFQRTGSPEQREAVGRYISALTKALEGMEHAALDERAAGAVVNEAEPIQPEDRGREGLAFEAPERDWADLIEAEREMARLGQVDRNRPPEFVRAIGGLPADVQAGILGSANENGESDLFHALKNNDPEAIRAYARAIEELPTGVQTVALHAMSRNGDSGFFHALNNGNEDAIRAYADVIQHLDPNTQTALLYEPSGLRDAMQNGHAETITAYAEAIGHLHPDQQNELLRIDLQGLPEAAGNENNAQQRAREAYLDAIRKIDGLDPAALAALEAPVAAAPLQPQPIQQPQEEEDYGFDDDEFDEEALAALDAAEAPHAAAPLQPQPIQQPQEEEDYGFDEDEFDEEALAALDAAEAPHAAAPLQPQPIQQPQEEEEFGFDDDEFDEEALAALDAAEAPHAAAPLQPQPVQQPQEEEDYGLDEELDAETLAALEAIEARHAAGAVEAPPVQVLAALDAIDPQHAAALPNPAAPLIPPALGAWGGAMQQPGVALSPNELALNGEHSALFNAMLDHSEEQGRQIAEQHRLLAPMREGATLGLGVALKQGDRAAVAAYGQFAESLPPAMQIEFMQPRTADGDSALSLAIQNGHAKTIEAYAKAIQKLQADTPAKLALLDAVDPALVEHIQRSGSGPQRLAAETYLTAVTEVMADREEHGRVDLAPAANAHAAVNAGVARNLDQRGERNDRNRGLQR
jgi:ankyrin repeat protein